MWKIGPLRKLLQNNNYFGFKTIRSSTSGQSGNYGQAFGNQSQNRSPFNNVKRLESQHKISESDEDVVNEEHVFNIDKCESFDSANLLTLNDQYENCSSISYQYIKLLTAENLKSLKLLTLTTT